eukprot:8224553-Pyramimonas_sp.AAC.1
MNACVSLLDEAIMFESLLAASEGTQTPDERVHQQAKELSRATDEVRARWSVRSEAGFVLLEALLVCVVRSVARCIDINIQKSEGRRRSKDTQKRERC